MLRLVVLLMFFLFLAGCGSGKAWRFLPESESDIREIFVVSHGWHTGVVISAEILEQKLAFLEEDFSGARYYEIGWGDKGFYQASEITSGLALEALIWPTQSVMHVVSVPSDPAIYFPHSELLSVQVSAEGLDNMAVTIAQAFTRNSDGQVIRSENGLYGQSRFYEAHEKYYLTNTCNTWIARLLDSAGVPVRTTLTLTADSVMDQVREATAAFHCCLPVNKKATP